MKGDYFGGDTNGCEFRPNLLANNVVNQFIPEIV